MNLRLAMRCAVTGSITSRVGVGRDLTLDDMFAVLPDILEVPPEDQDGYARPRVFIDLRAQNVIADLHEGVSGWRPDLIVRESTGSRRGRSPSGSRSPRHCQPFDCVVDRHTVRAAALGFVAGGPGAGRQLVEQAGPRAWIWWARAACWEISRSECWSLEAEMTDHLGYDKHDPTGRDGGNSP